MAEILPSILSADFAHLGDQVAELAEAGCRMLHVDVMDGHFVPNLTIGPPVVQSLRKATELVLDCHLMISDADRYAPLFIEAGANLVSVHQEACTHLDRTLRQIKSAGAKAGVVINPATPVATLESVLDLVDYVLVMSVNPGFGGQTLIPYTLGKVRQLAELRRERSLDFALEIDGGITLENVGEAVRSGAEWIVAGSSVFRGGNPGQAFRQLSAEVREAKMVRT